MLWLAWLGHDVEGDSLIRTELATERANLPLGVVTWRRAPGQRFRNVYFFCNNDRFSKIKMLSNQARDRLPHTYTHTDMNNPSFCLQFNFPSWIINQPVASSRADTGNFSRLNFSFFFGSFSFCCFPSWRTGVLWVGLYKQTNIIILSHTKWKHTHSTNAHPKKVKNSKGETENESSKGKPTWRKKKAHRESETELEKSFSSQ